MAPARTVLVTGFEPFGGDRVNASELAVRPLDGRVIAGHRVVVRILPCVFGDAAEALRGALRTLRPRLVIACGEAGGRPGITVERVAINVDDARIADNAGGRPIDRPIARRGPVGYWSRLPIKSIARALEEQGIPAAVSQTAGTFVCNHVFYELMRALARRPGVRGGFVHVPRCELQEDGRTPTMATATTTRALEIAIATALATRRDAKVTGGATH
ncbi:MAG: pyroglutamyl-peptidase I [Sandaracinus sp.]